MALEKRIGTLLEDIMDRFGTGATGLGRAGPAEAPDKAMTSNTAEKPRWS